MSKPPKRVLRPQKCSSATGEEPLLAVRAQHLHSCFSVTVRTGLSSKLAVPSAPSSAPGVCRGACRSPVDQRGRRSFLDVIIDRSNFVSVGPSPVTCSLGHRAAGTTHLSAPGLCHFVE